MKTTMEQHKRLVLEAFDMLFNKRDYAAAETFWSANYIQHSAHIPPGRDGLFNLVKASPGSLKYEHGLIVAEGDFVMVHGRYSNTGLPVNWIIVDILRIEKGVLVEHWDVIQDEATKAQSKSRLPMFGDHFPKKTKTRLEGVWQCPHILGNTRCNCRVPVNHWLTMLPPFIGREIAHRKLLLNAAQPR